jgi:hypothetical protein
MSLIGRLLEPLEGRFFVFRNSEPVSQEIANAILSLGISCLGKRPEHRKRFFRPTFLHGGY